MQLDKKEMQSITHMEIKSNNLNSTKKYQLVASHE